MHPQEEIGPPEHGDGYIFIALIDSVWDWSLGILHCVCPRDFLSKKWKAPLSQTVFHPIGKIVPWCPCFDNEPIGAGFAIWMKCG